MKFLETLEPAKTSKQNIIVIIPTCHYTYSAIFTSSIWNYFDTNFLVSFKCFDIFLDRNPSKCWTLKDRLCSGFYSVVWAWWFLHITPVSRPIYFEIKVLIARCVFLCWGNLRISGLLQVLAEVENTSMRTAIQWSLQTQVAEQKVWITWNVHRRSMHKKRGDIIPACQAVILCTCMFEQIYTILPNNLPHLVCRSCLSPPLHNSQNTRHGNFFKEPTVLPLLKPNVLRTNLDTMLLQT